MGLLDGWRNEKFDVIDDNGQALFKLERAVFRPLDLLSQAVHVNGFTQQKGEWKFWIARRSPFKAVDPNKLDNLVGGDIASGENMKKALLREGQEEAGLTEQILQKAIYAVDCFSVRQVARGLHREKLHIFDVVLSERTLPENQDGEVAEFILIDYQELASLMSEGHFMNDALLVTIRCFSAKRAVEKNAFSDTMVTDIQT